MYINPSGKSIVSCSGFDIFDIEDSSINWIWVQSLL